MLLFFYFCFQNALQFGNDIKIEKQIIYLCTILEFTHSKSNIDFKLVFFWKNQNLQKLLQLSMPTEY